MKITLIIIFVIIIVFLFLLIFITEKVTNGVISFRTLKIYKPELFGFNRINKNLYVSSSCNSDKYDFYISKVNEAIENINNFYGAQKANCKIIVCDPSTDFLKLVKEAHRGITYYFTIIVTADAFNVGEKVITHEMSHSEIIARLGIFRQLSLPRWFDEGLAIYVCNADSIYYGTQIMEKSIKNYNFSPSLEKLSSAKDWMKTTKIHYSLSYSYAYQEFKRWYSIVGKKGLNEFLKDFKANGDFQKTYSKIEAKYNGFSR